MVPSKLWHGLKGLTCDHAFVLVDQVPQLLIGLHIKGALVIADPLHPGEPEAVVGGKVPADDCAHISLHLYTYSKESLSCDSCSLLS